MTTVTDFSLPELQIYTNLNEPQLYHFYEPQPGLFICESPNVILRALEAGYEPVSLLAEDKIFAKDNPEGALFYEMSREAVDTLLKKKKELPIYTAPLSVLKELTGYSLTRGMLCAMMRRSLPAPDSLIRDKKRIAVLEGVTNPTNVGAIFRSAAALGMDAVLLTDDCADPLYRRAARVSMGTVFQIPWTCIRKDGYVSVLSDCGFKTAAMALADNTVDIRDPDLQREEKLAVILGNEGYGLTEETIQQCSYVIRIPMAAGVDSLNVAAASAVAFWQLGTQKGLI